MAALPQSPAALPTHMLAASSSPSSASSSGASSASTSPASSRSNSFSSVDQDAYASYDCTFYWWQQQYAAHMMMSAWCAAATSTIAHAAPSATEYQSDDEEEEEECIANDADDDDDWRPAARRHRRKQRRHVEAGHRANEIGDQGEDTLAEQLSRHPAVAVAVRLDTPDGKADLSVRLYGADVNQYRAVQIKASMQDNLRYFQPAVFVQEYGDVVCVYVNYTLKIAFVGMGRDFVAAGREAPGRKRLGVRPNVELNASRLIRLNDLELGHKQLCDRIVELLPKSLEIGTPIKLAPTQWAEYDSKLIVKSLQVPNLNGQYAAAPTSHSKEDCTIQSERVQLKARSKASYQLSSGTDRLNFKISHRVDGQAGVPYDPGMAIMLIDTRCPERIYWLTAEQAALEGITGARKRWVSVTVYSPRDCPAGDPWRKYLYPRDADLIALQQKQQQKQSGSASTSSASAVGSAEAAELATTNVEQLQRIVAAAQAQILQIQVAQAQQ